ncbi:class I SAM-dependent methyltransferase [Rhodoferax sp. GW822-FHT02A01]|uniref:class I SAM-dependent methyltransferase n=1 Tax=Rhodoferax sp. GW822-FHT02A01 TaxID=3141537 RepID=UPI00315D6F53
MARAKLWPGHWQWPLPAVLAWALAWFLFKAMASHGFAAGVALGAASAVGVACSLWGETWWRRLLIGAGFPLSLAILLTSSGASAVPPWAWLVPLVLLLLVYPINAWRDAPVFPTPADALLELPRHAALPAGALILDAGCGAGHGLQALRTAYPDAVLHGLEWSWPLRWLSAMRCPWARVRRGNIWLADWSDYDMVYLFQRPESMTRAELKAREMKEGAWLVSLDFEATDLRATARYRTPGGKMVWVYRAPMVVL